MVTCKGATRTAQTPQVVIRDLPRVACTSPLTYYIDRSRGLSFDEVQKKIFSNQTSGLMSAVRTYGEHVNYWLKFSVENLDSLPVKAFLDAGYFGDIRVYELQNGTVTIQNGGAGVEKNIDVPPPELYTVRLVLPPKTKIQYVVRLSSTPDYGTTFQQVTISSKEYLYGSYYRGYYQIRTFRFLQVLFFGFMLSQMLYVGFSRLIGIKRKEYLFYLFYLIVITGYFLLKYDSAIGIYWPIEYYPSIREYLKSVSLALPYLFYVKFIRYFLDLGDLDKGVHTRLIHLERFILVYVLADTSLRIILSAPEALNDILMIAIFAIAVYCLTVIFQLMKYRKVLINLILTGSLVAVLGGGIGILLTVLQYDTSILHTNFNSLVSGQIGIVLETIIFTTALSYKTRMMEIEKVESQEKLIAQMGENAALKDRMEQTRNKIARDLHDDIGSTLSSILLLSNAAKIKIRLKAGEARETLARISGIASTMIDEMSDIIWAINPRQDSMDQILNRMQYYAAPLAFARNMQFSLKAEDNIRHLYLSMEKRKNLFLIFKESIINALKYSEATTLRANFYSTNGCLHMVVEDDGKGFSHPSNPGNGLNNMKTRAESMGGEADICSMIDGGTTVHVRLPL